MQPKNSRREAAFLIVDTARLLRSFVEKQVRPHGMTRAQWAVLARLEREEAMMQAELADLLEIQPIALVRLIDQLCEQGLVERRADAMDRRCNRLFLTEAGRRRLGELDSLGSRIGETVFGNCKEQDLLELTRMLGDVRTSIKAATEADAAPREKVDRHAAG